MPPQAARRLNPVALWLDADSARDAFAAFCSSLPGAVHPRCRSPRSARSLLRLQQAAQLPWRPLLFACLAACLCAIVDQRIVFSARFACSQLQVLRLSEWLCRRPQHSFAAPWLVRTAPTTPSRHFAVHCPALSTLGAACFIPRWSENSETTFTKFTMFIPILQGQQPVRAV